jgi:hypothetical protein
LRADNHKSVKLRYSHFNYAQDLSNQHNNFGFAGYVGRSYYSILCEVRGVDAYSPLFRNAGMKDLKRSVLQPDRQISRRGFIGSVAATATAFTIVPRHVLGGPGHTPPSEKLNIAFIGAGGQGERNIAQLSDQNIVALCDVDEERAAKTFRLYPDTPKYRDFRRMLEKQKDIEAVVVTTPDHTHAVAAMMAIKMGKHVYCEKPLTYSIYESRKLTEAAREARIATQMGIHHHAGQGLRLGVDVLQAGVIGKVHEVHLWTERPRVLWAQGIDRPRHRCRKRWTGTCGLARLPIGRTTRLTCHSRGAAGGILGPAPLAIWDAT